MSRVTVVGGGLAGLLAAYRLLGQGNEVTVLEAGEALGGMLASVDLAGVRVDSGAEAYATRGGVVAPLAAELGLGVAAPTGQPHVWWPTGIHPLAEGVMGIPASFDDPAWGALSADELALARRDLELGPEVGADAKTVGELVEARLGCAVVERLVAPLTTGVYGSHPDKLALYVAPGLIPALASEGSLVAAVAKVRNPGAASVEQPIGGMFKLIEALAERIEALGGEIRTGAEVTGLAPGHVVHLADGTSIEADRVVLAAPAAATLALVSQLGVVLEAPAVHTARHAMLAVTTPALAADPIGSGVLMGQRDDSVAAKALTHYSAKWPWARETIDGAPAPEVLRVSYPEDVLPTAEQAVADASALTGVPIGIDEVVGFASLGWGSMPERISPDRRDQLLAGAASVGVELVGAWLDGNGIAAVVAGVERVLA